MPFSSPACTLLGVKKYAAEGKKINVVYLVDHALGIKVFADKAFYAIGGSDPKKPEVVPFLLKKDAEAHARKTGGKLATYAEALSAITAGTRAIRWTAWQACMLQRSRSSAGADAGRAVESDGIDADRNADAADTAAPAATRRRNRAAARSSR